MGMIRKEKYNVVMDETQTTVFLESYSEDNGRKPQAWYHTQGNGKVAVFIPGHDHSVLSHPMVSRGINNNTGWLNN